MGSKISALNISKKNQILRLDMLHFLQQLLLFIQSVIIYTGTMRLS